MKTERQKLKSAASHAIIDNLVTECLSFEEFEYFMREYEAPDWFDVRKCWQEETGEQVQVCKLADECGATADAKKMCAACAFHYSREVRYD